ncbi:hypothetical protein DL237_00050 [Pseudooceanicola sediminis]|uniref:Uncharacterized protein n=1 Tax=Pseudooceanicola sediminis TaxID=2211117 RepID=A0A399J5K8_9RHOB|nr:hypothetical protein [Pseudooceanicola sediminis]KAA2317190.1 hypothetical protein E0K93_02495 [Puniceibacterium sp. HSS470]RII40460.1 hypothetical protein DL237_00050 [Pseudooceanicola sediminis]|tara:strand:- start:39994 stop:41160 length:1167 start_codon:yes stop_codon:yes gene_type:complete
MIQRDGSALRYLSDQYRGQLMGYEERERLTLAQTPPLALAMLSFGDMRSSPRTLPERFDYHVVNQHLSGAAPDLAARSQAVLTQMHARRDGLAFRTVLAIEAQQPGLTLAEAAPDAPLAATLNDQLATGAQALSRWQKHLHVDRIDLSLLSGAPDTDEAQADAHYARTALWLGRAVAATTGQASVPHIVVAQSAGTRDDGTSGVILAEARLDLDHPTLKFIVATPGYPYGFLPGMPATHDATSAALMDEIKVLAVRQTQQGTPWRCPSLSLVHPDGDELRAHFITDAGLAFDPDEPHGFALHGCDNGAQITGVRVMRGPPIVRIFCDKAPTGAALSLSYAWGATADGQQDRAANRGGLRDTWQADSLAVPGHVLRRYALSGLQKVVTG